MPSRVTSDMRSDISNNFPITPHHYCAPNNAVGLGGEGLFGRARATMRRINFHCVRDARKQRVRHHQKHERWPTTRRRRCSDQSYKDRRVGRDIRSRSRNSSYLVAARVALPTRKPRVLGAGVAVDAVGVLVHVLLLHVRF